MQAAPAAAGNEVTQHHVKVVAVVAADATAEVVVVARLLRATGLAAEAAVVADLRLVRARCSRRVAAKILATQATQTVQMRVTAAVVQGLLEGLLRERQELS